MNSKKCKIAQNQDDAKCWIKSNHLENQFYQQTTEKDSDGHTHLYMKMIKDNDSFVVCPTCWKKATYEKRIMNKSIIKKRYYKRLLILRCAIALVISGVVYSFCKILSHSCYSENNIVSMIMWYVSILCYPLLMAGPILFPLLFLKLFEKYRIPIYYWTTPQYKKEVWAYSIEEAYEKFKINMPRQIVLDKKDIKCIRELTIYESLVATKEIYIVGLTIKGYREIKPDDWLFCCLNKK